MGTSVRSVFLSLIYWRLSCSTTLWDGQYAHGLEEIRPIERHPKVGFSLGFLSALWVLEPDSLLPFSTRPRSVLRFGSLGSVPTVEGRFPLSRRVWTGG